MLCLTVLLASGCAGKKEESGKQNDDYAQVQAKDKKDKKQPRQLKQAASPLFIPNGIRSVSLKREGDEFLYISREPAEYKMKFDYWEMLNPYDENVTMNTEVMFEMFQELCSLSFETPVELEEGVDTGLIDSKMGYRVEYVDTLDDTLAQKREEADTEAEIILGKEDGKGGRYAAVAGSEEKVYVLSDTVLQMIFGRKPFDYILKIPVLISADSLKDIEITTGGRQYVIQVDTKADSYKFGGKDVKKEEFAALYQLISGVRLEAEADEGRRRDEEEPLLTVDFHRNMEGAPDVRVSYYVYDEEFASVRVDQAERFLVRQEDLRAVIEGIEEAF